MTPTLTNSCNDRFQNIMTEKCYLLSYHSVSSMVHHRRIAYILQRLFHTLASCDDFNCDDHLITNMLNTADN